MAVNLLNSGWTTQRQTSTINITADSSYVHFNMGYVITDEMACAKACIAINASNYQNITLQYSSGTYDGITSLYFGVFDSMTAVYSGGITSASLSGTGVTEIQPGASGTINIDIPSNVSGTKYVGFLFYGNTYNFNEYVGWSAQRRVNISSLTAVERGYTLTYDANGGSGAPSPDTKIDGQTIIVSYTLPTPPANTSITYTVTLDATGGTCDPDKVTITNVVIYEFVDWNTEPDGSGTSYKFGDPYSYNSDMTLYAQYSSTTTCNSVTLPTSIRSGYDFLGWSTNAEDTSGITGEYIPTGDITLYATWKRRGLVHICDSTGSFNLYEVFIYDGSGWSLYVPYIYTESGWIEYSG